MILIDAHVHIHNCYRLRDFLSYSKFNFSNQLKNMDKTSGQFVICLSESHRTDMFTVLSQKSIQSNELGKWKVFHTNDKNSLIIKDDKDFSMIVVAGRQIVTKENLEVLALGLLEDPEDGNEIEVVLEYVKNNGSIPIIPWGVGKWFGKRKEIVDNLLNRESDVNFFIGDNGNRPFFWKKPRIFDSARANRVFNIPGSDPLPFLDYIKRPGSFGFVIDGKLDLDRPFTSLRKMILTSNQQFETYGKLETAFNFLKHQVAMQIVKRNR